jgi:hypothetical protein
MARFLFLPSPHAHFLLQFHSSLKPVAASSSTRAAATTPSPPPCRTPAAAATSSLARHHRAAWPQLPSIARPSPRCHDIVAAPSLAHRRPEGKFFYFFSF